MDGGSSYSQKNLFEVQVEHLGLSLLGLYTGHPTANLQISKAAIIPEDRIFNGELAKRRPSFCAGIKGTIHNLLST